jgi:hypothetical protein
MMKILTQKMCGDKGLWVTRVKNLSFAIGQAEQQVPPRYARRNDKLPSDSRVPTLHNHIQDDLRGAVGGVADYPQR